MLIEIIEGLKNSKSSIRRSAAKKIRKIKDPIYCPLLLDALSTEIHKNTWETQYQIIMAIGETKCHNALEFLYSILNNMNFLSFHLLNYSGFLVFLRKIQRILLEHFVYCIKILI